MKNKLSYFIGVAFVLCYTSTFTSCVNGVDDEYLDQVITGDGESNNEEEEIPELSGEYYEGGEFELKMFYNGDELTGKKVIVAADEINETATITFTGTELKLEDAISAAIPGYGGLVSGLGLDFTTFGPVPGVKEMTFPEIKLYKRGGLYAFEGEDTTPTYSMSFKGTIEDGIMEIKIKHELTNDKLAGTWKLADKFEKPTANAAPLFAPLWCDWDSRMITSLGKIQIELVPGSGSFVPLDLSNSNFNGVFGVLASAGTSGKVMDMLLGKVITIESLVCNMLQSVTAERGGCMYAIYNWNEDFTDTTNPKWSSPDGMSHNILRYYYNPEIAEKEVDIVTAEDFSIDRKTGLSKDIRETRKAKAIPILLEANPSFLMDMILGMLAPATRGISTRNDDPEATKELGRQLFKVLVPILQKGIPCDAVLEGNDLMLNIDGVVLRDLLSKVMAVLNDDLVKPVIMDALSGLGDFGTNIGELLNTMPDALKYHHLNKETGEPEGECGEVKLGLKFVRGN